MNIISAISFRPQTRQLSSMANFNKSVTGSKLNSSDVDTVSFSAAVKDKNDIAKAFEVLQEHIKNPQFSTEYIECKDSYGHDMHIKEETISEKLKFLREYGGKNEYEKLTMLCEDDEAIDNFNLKLHQFKLSDANTFFNKHPQIDSVHPVYSNLAENVDITLVAIRNRIG